MSAARARLAVFVAALLLAAACSGIDEDVQEAATNVLTLQTGTVSALKDLRGTGPFRTYDVPPTEMLEVIRRAAGRARGLGGEPVRAIFVSERRGEVVAKERPPERASSTSYEGPFRTAVVATVHVVSGAPDRSRVEIHATSRGPFHGGRVEWERDLPGWIDAELAARSVPAPRIRPIR